MRRLLLASICTLVMAMPVFAAADSGSSSFVPLANYQGTQLSTILPSSGTTATTSTLPDYVNRLFQIAIGIGALAAVGRLMYGGYLYMFKDSFAKKQDAKKVIGDAFIGLFVLLGIYLILNEINPQILNLNSLQTDFQSSGNYQNTGPTVI